MNDMLQLAIAFLIFTVGLMVLGSAVLLYLFTRRAKKFIDGEVEDAKKIPALGPTVGVDLSKGPDTSACTLVETEKGRIIYTGSKDPAMFLQALKEHEAGKAAKK